MGISSRFYSLLNAMLCSDFITSHCYTVTLTPLSLRRGVRAGAIGVLLLGGLNMLGVVGLRNGALGMPFSGAEKRKKTIINYHYHSCVLF